MAELKSGTKVKDRYTLKEFKGSGSFGEVWLAHDEVLDSDVAVKIYISVDPHGVEEFRSEYITTLGISHPNLLTTTYFDVWEHRPFLVMPYCAKGASTSRAGEMDEYELWQFIHDVAAGLGYLHGMSEPIIHQDIKPDNILVDDSSRFLITDFGISKKVRSTMRKQSKRAVGAGATAYMGPERFDADPSPVKASDIWSLGVSIYELATGELPFSGLGGGMQKNGAEIPSLGNKWSKDLNMVMQSCLAKETWDRPTARQLEQFSEAILNGQPASATWHSAPSASAPSPVPEPPAAEEHSNSKRAWMAVGAIIVALLFLIIVWPTGSDDDEPIIIPESTVDSIVPTEKTPAEPADIPQVQKQAAPKEEAKPTPAAKKDEPKAEKPDNNAAILREALAAGDYQRIQQLANQGYAPAYLPMARFNLSNHNYKAAENYAQKAINAGLSDGNAILQTLESLGYYD